MSAASLQQQLDSLWSLLENHYAMTSKDDKILRELDDLICDESLTQSHFDSVKSNLLKNRLKSYDPYRYKTEIPAYVNGNRTEPTNSIALFGDFELLIDKYLGGSKLVKEKVMIVDTLTLTSGFKALNAFLEESGSTGYKDDHVYKMCLSDLTFKRTKRVTDAPKYQYIKKHGAKYLVRLSNQPSVSFPSLEKAISYRNKHIKNPKDKVKLQPQY